MSVGAALLSLAACATPDYHPQISDVAIMPGYSVATVNRVAYEQTVKVEVLGNPFRLPVEAFDGQVAAHMNLSGAAYSITFTTHPDAGNFPNTRVVWNFAPPGDAVPPNSICRHENVDPSRVSTKIDAYVAFCQGDQALSSVRGRLFYAESQNSPSFYQLIETMTFRLFPTDPGTVRRSGEARLAAPTQTSGGR